MWRHKMCVLKFENMYTSIRHGEINNLERLKKR